MDDLFTQARQSAMGYLARREHSRLELRQKLARKGFTADIIDQVLTQLQANHLINETRFVESFMHHRINQGYGPVRIQSDLRLRGIERELLADMLDSDAPVWVERAHQVRQKRFGDHLPTDRREWAKQMRFLQYRGFTNSQIKMALQSLE
ncbi:MAG: hypothetical protein BWK79_03905 [Beggiatoa sp. IS2]|nr:MAG: hypothetical protein BWK79_03905 [Beggiatoa sp. IS2]